MTLNNIVTLKFGLEVTQCQDQVVGPPNTSGMKLFTGRFIYNDMYNESQRRAHSRNIRVDKVLRRVLPRRSQWNVPRRHVYTRWNVLPIVQSVGRAAGPALVTWSQSRFQRHIRSVLPAEKRWSHDHDLPLGDENIFAVLYVSLCYGPYTLLKNNSFFTFIFAVLLLNLLYTGCYS